ncbi:tRNA pseudouridine(38-40) synthase TruA [Tepidibacillus fermentans]|uniref:tRNA pseudouridine synthase A n=1 Tax=Tepidibacillus fermentans TaxID=1281767 RepID=A0A4R3KDY0_9BACI|nr:tRNA pseudouridine(38-40) synthase TruA [Tepidibacillus fermentans]TCS81516.1 tRNA pseudouridine38-40 synthase [Tepidibacillus fermentans]
MERNIKLELSYDGTKFHGFQVQPNQRTVQSEIEKAIKELTGFSVNLIASGRTDAGVHARKQVCNFITHSSIPIAKWPNALNSILPDDIIVFSAEEKPLQFHSRYDVKRKTYRYTIYNDRFIDVFKRHYSWHLPYSLNISEMVEASHYFLGEHDFTSFSSARTEVKNKVRTIYQFDIWKEGKEIYFQITGNGFLYNMVRIIVGTIVEIGRGRMEKEQILRLFEEKDRTLSGLTAPPQGLVLWDVIY